MSNNIQPPPTSEPQLDIREQLFNGGETGPIQQIQVEASLIFSLRGILFDFDLHMYAPGDLIPDAQSPEELYQQVVRPWLDHHPVLACMEVRMSGSGLHGILRFDKPVELPDEGAQQRWAACVEVVQAALPIDPGQPGITATTRAIGSINSKNGRTVELLTPGKPVTVDEVLSLRDQMKIAPFRTVMENVTGSSRLTPCPVCRHSDATLSALDHVGKCYGSSSPCGQVNLAQFYDLLLQPRRPDEEAGQNANN